MTDPASLPRVGMLATVRNRRGLIVSVDPYDARPEGRLHLVRVEYTDSDGAPEDTLLWERERHRVLLEPTKMPQVAGEPPMPPAELDALVRATRWSALTPFIRPHAPGAGPELAAPELPVASPFFGAVQVEDFQLVPLLKALQMPRVSLLLADDVGLGKTVEAGLVLTELLLRRRIRRVLILTPAALRKQWQQEMRDKFSLSVDIVDREETHALQKRLGLDANPWRTFPRIVASYYYLRQPDVLEQFLAVCRAEAPGAQLPWDLLVVDEAHNLMPSNFGDDSDLSRMLRAISPYFEHKLFLTATPHNGHTRCFTGLLEQLDPVRFTQKSDLTDAERARIEDVLVRRLKSEINALDDRLGRPRRFAERYPDSIQLHFSARERAVSEAFAKLRAAIKQATARARDADRVAGSFALEVLGKRLLSCPATFADSWRRFRQGLRDAEAATAAEVAAARRAGAEEIDDDREREGRAQHAARTSGAWLKPFAAALEPQLAAVDEALARLGLEPAAAEEPIPDPKDDARLDRLLGLVDKHLRKGKRWADDERLIVFTEYKTTLDYLERRLRRAVGEDPAAIRVLYGGMSLAEREDIKRAFNDPDDPVRVLLATDAAAEGLNLQETARLLLHVDVPWNPSRLEQRNGRLDRHGQARKVTAWHFTSEDDADLRFLGKVVDKVHAIRDDLGSMGEVFDAAFQRRFEDLEDADQVAKGLDVAVETHRGRAVIPRPPIDAGTAAQAERVAALRRELDLDPGTLRDTLEIALGLGAGLPRLDGPDARGRMRLKLPIPRRWEPLVDESLRLPTRKGDRGALPALIFDPELFVTQIGERPVFRPAKDTVLLHLGHPMFREALATFARLRFPGDKDLAAPSRWCVRRGPVPAGADALILLTVEELAVNELREPFHHWVRTLRFPVKGDALGARAGEIPPADDRVPAAAPVGEEGRRRAIALWDEIWLDLRDALSAHARDLTAAVRRALDDAGKRGLRDEKKRYDHRLKEVEAAMRETTLARLQKEIDKLDADLKQGLLFEDLRRDLAEKRRNLEDELQRRQTRYRELLELLRADQDRVLTRMLPRRYELRGDVQVFPVAVEIRLPEVSA